VKFAIAISVDLHTRLVADFHVYDIVFVHIDARFHVAEIGHAHHFRAGELIVATMRSPSLLFKIVTVP
jgi:hypothetical protein